jgi:hypothetical protein
MMQRLFGALCASFILAAGALAGAQQVILPSEPVKGFGASITAAYEGWYDNPDGTHVFLIGYYNRNRSQTLDIPIGPNNRIEPGGPDMGQPTHFLPGRQTGVFSITVPKEFALPEKLTWTIVANGQTTSIPFRMNADYVISPFTDVAVGNKPPVIRFEERGATIQGPIAQLSKALTRTASMSTPLSLTVWVDDDAKYSSGNNAPMKNPPPPVSYTWAKFRGPGAVTFDKASPKLDVLAGGQVDVPFRGKATTTARFGEPGEYVLAFTANDFSGDGGGGEVCCWTSALVKVTVTP